MKKALLFLSILLFTGISYSQCPIRYPNEINFFKTGGGADYGGYGLSMFGEDSEKLKVALLEKYPNYKRSGSRYKIKSAVIPGIHEPVTILIYHGIHEKRVNGSSFSSFKNVKEKRVFLENMNSSQNLGVNIYFKRKRKSALKELEEAEIAKEYFESLYK